MSFPDLVSPAESETRPAGSQTAEPRRRGHYLAAWIVSWFGIAAAGGMFGMLLDGIAGFLFGVIIAGAYAVPIAATVATLAWTFWLSRFQIALATMAGAATGITSTVFLMSDGSFAEILPFASIAGCIGGGVSGLTAFGYWQKHDRPRQSAQDNTSLRWQFSLRDLILRFTIVSILIVAWSLAIAHFMNWSVTIVNFMN